MQTTSLGLAELLRRAKDKSLIIPQFQRQFVWRESQVKMLIDSISRAYPVGSLLLLDKKLDLPLAGRGIEAAIRADAQDGKPLQEEDVSDVESYILDGQQRIASIARVFLNAHPVKLYYFDLKLLFELHNREETSWIKIRKRGKTAPPRRKDHNRLLRADIILDQEEADIYVSEYVEDSGDFPQFDKRGRLEAAARIKGIFEKMRNYKIPVVTLERDSGVESVCRVFETVNSTVTRLTTFDLAVARFYSTLDLRKLWEHARQSHSILEDFKVDGEGVLQVLYLAEAARSQKYPDPTRSNLLGLSGNRIESEWEKSSHALAETYKWARAHGARPKTLPNHNVLIALAAIRGLFLDDVTKEVWKNHDFIRRWYFSKVMQAGASQASNYRIGQDFNALWRYKQDNENENKQPDVLEVNLDSVGVLKLKPSDVRYRALQNIFATTIKQDLISGGTIDSESTLHDHHIFPKNARKRHKLPSDMLDGICNRIPMLGKSNWELGEGYPHEYFRSLAQQARNQGTLDGLASRLRDAMIPGDPRNPSWADSFSIDRFEDFCRKRAELIIARVREVVGDSLRRTSPSDDETAEFEELW